MNLLQGAQRGLGPLTERSDLLKDGEQIHYLGLHIMGKSHNIQLFLDQRNESTI